MYSIGVDIGGTGIKAGIVSENGQIIHRANCKTDIESGFDKIISDINNMVRDLIDYNQINRNEIKSIGFGVPSFINNEGIVTCVNLGWFEVEFVSKLKSTFPEFDIFVENDATVAALAESKFGSMNGKDISVLITLGTGLGGGIIINGKPFTGNHGMASEIGHVVIGENTYNCNCGNNGCFETFCSATALIKHTQEILKEENVDLVVLAGYLKIISPKFVSEFENKMMNIHPSLIPSFCGDGFYGEKVHQAVIDYGAKVSGATVHFVNEEADAGPIIMQDTVKVMDDDDAKTLAKRVLEVEHTILPRCVKLFCEGKISVEGRKVKVSE